MAFFEWKDAYSVGVPELDDQHRALIEIINSLDAIEREGGEISRVLDTLDWYVEEHFATEEKLLKQAGYADYEGHQAEHRKFETWLKSTRFYMRNAGPQSAEAAKEVSDYLKDWLAKHILVMDMDYRDLLAPKG